MEIEFDVLRLFGAICKFFEKKILICKTMLLHHILKKLERSYYNFAFSIRLTVEFWLKRSGLDCLFGFWTQVSKE